MKKRGMGQSLRKPVLSRIGFRISGKIKAEATAAVAAAAVGESAAIGNARSHIYKSSLSKLNVIGAGSRMLSSQGVGEFHLIQVQR